jgi:hypothetical protein
VTILRPEYWVARMNKPRLLPPLFTLVLIVAMLMIDVFAPQFELVHPPVTYLGALPLALGISLNVLSAGAFKRRDTTINPFGESAVLVQDGFFV